MDGAVAEEAQGVVRQTWQRLVVLAGDLVLAANVLWVTAVLTDVSHPAVPLVLFAGLPLAFWLVRLYDLHHPVPVARRVAQVTAATALVGFLALAVDAFVPGLPYPPAFLAPVLGLLVVLGVPWRILVDRFEQKLVVDTYRFFSRHRRWVAFLMYVGVSAVAYVTAYLLRFELAIPPEHVTTLSRTLLFIVVLRLAGFRLLNLSMERWRHIGPRDMVRLVAAASVGSALFVALMGVLGPLPRVPRSVVLIDWMLVILMVAGVWLGYRTAFEVLYRRTRAAGNEIRRAIVIGAGEAGSRLVKEMLRDPMGYQPVGFVDDDQIKWKTRLYGLEVKGAIDWLPEVALDLRAEALIIAIPSADPADLRRVVEICESTELPFKVLPSTEEVLSGSVGPNQLRDVRIEDLLGRDPVRLELPELRQALVGRTVLITGGAGSIGSELARQVAVNGPARLVLFDKNESEVYFLDLELRRAHPDLDIVAVVGDLLDEPLLEQVFHEHHPQVVFHAAAYKHVPLMEHNPRSAVRNNVLGTGLVAEAAGRHGVGRFVLISTDKAVRPVNVMGATKRAAELIVLDCARRFPSTWYTGVRFGNVLGSRGSVVPLFERQLEAGEPLTVTDPDVTRYFMTIPEAVQLVLQASLLEAARGRIAMLDMGEPVRILDLARRLIRLKGLEEGIDTRIEFCGLRPGEKLHEELSSDQEQTLPTDVAKIRVIATPFAGEAVAGVLPATLLRLRDGRGLSPRASVALLEGLVPEFGEKPPAVELSNAATA